MNETLEQKEAATFEVNGKTYTVGDELTLSSKATTEVKRLKKAHTALVKHRGALYDHLLFGATLRGDVTEYYTEKYQTANRDYNYANQRMHQQMVQDIGGFLPMTVTVADEEPKVVVREQQEGERLELTKDDVATALGVTNASGPLVNFLSEYGTTSMEADPETLALLGQVFVSGVFDKSFGFETGTVNSREAVEATPFVQQLPTMLKHVLSDVTMPPAVIVAAAGEEFASIAMSPDVLPKVNTTAITANLVETLLTGKEETPVVTLATVYTAFDQSAEGEAPSMTINVGINHGVRGNTERCHLQYLVVDGEPTLNTFMTSEEMAEYIQKTVEARRPKG